MSALPLAHAGHWLIQLLYAVPVLAFLGAVAWVNIKERRERRLSDRERRD